MKKVLALMLVLGLASLANAGMIAITGVNGETAIEAAAGSTISLQLVYTGSPSVQMIDVLLDPVNGVVPIGSVVITATNVEMGIVQSGADILAADGVTVGSASSIEVAPMQSQSGVLGGPVIATFSLNYAGGDFFFAPKVVGMFDQSFNGFEAEVAGIQITEIIPEPATMALLGLGGLFFARKK